MHWWEQDRMRRRRMQHHSKKRHCRMEHYSTKNRLARRRWKNLQQRWRPGLRLEPLRRPELRLPLAPPVPKTRVLPGAVCLEPDQRFLPMSNFRQLSPSLSKIQHGCRERGWPPQSLS
jgi:hypothetical protein